MLSRAMISLLLIAALAAPALGQLDAPPWELRAYLSTYTDDKDRSGSRTWAWNYTAIRHQHVCTHCGYSAPVANPGDVCPNPWGLTDHSPTETNETVLIVATPRQRVLGYLRGLMADNSGGMAEYPLVGRPFRPGGTDEPRSIDGGTEQIGWNAHPIPWERPDPTDPNSFFAPEDVGSFMTLRATGFEDVVSNGDGLRFLVIEPGSVRAAASYDYLNWNGTEDEVGDGSDFYTTAGGDAGDATAEQYLVHINPYRVSDGDEYIIRHHERWGQVGGVGSPFRTRELNIQVYSTLYGNDFDTGTEMNEARRMRFYDNDGCVIVTNSGALRIEIPRQFHVDAPDPGETRENTWVIKVRINSNTMTLPRPREVDYDYEMKYADGVGVFNDPGEEEPNLIDDIAADLSFFKAPYVLADTSRSPLLSTADELDGVLYEVEEKTGEAFISKEIWPYRMPAGAVGRGRAMLQWSDRNPDPSWVAVPVDLPDGRPVFFRTGREWHYVVDPDHPSERLVTNPDVANQRVFDNQIPDPPTVNPVYIDTHFMCSRLDPQLTRDIWARWEPGMTPGTFNDLGEAESDIEEATGGFPRIILGEENLVGVGGEWGPGTPTPTRTFGLGNRMPAFVTVGEPPQAIPARVLVCPVEEDGCGTMYLNDLLSAGDPCPACGVELRAVRGQAEPLYDGVRPLTADLGGTGIFRMPFDALSFLPGGSMIPMGASDYPQQVRADIPRYQPPSVPGAGFFNDIANDEGYRGTVVAFHRDQIDDQFSRNGAWDSFYLAPGSGARLVSPDEAGADDYETRCVVCDSRHPNGATDCSYCGASLTADDPLSQSTLVAEEYAPFGVQVSVLRRGEMAADAGLVDLGWVAPGTPADAPNTVTETMADGSVPMPADVSRSGRMRVRNEGNVELLSVLTHSGHLYRAEIDPATQSLGRSARTMPLPNDVIFGPAGALTLRHQEQLGAAGEPAAAVLQAGSRDDGVLRPVPMGQPVGHHSGDALLFIDDGDGHFSFWSARLNAETTTEHHQFDPTIDEALEPVIPLAAAMRVVEARVPQSDFYSADAEPTLLIDAGRGNLQVIWVAQREAADDVGDEAAAGTSETDLRSPAAPTNIVWSDATLNASGSPLYRGWLWDSTDDLPDEAKALTASDDANERHSSPFAYIDPNNSSRWALWRRSLTTLEGASSQLYALSSNSSDWSGGVASAIHGTAGALQGIAGFVRQGAADRHWLLWTVGPEGREQIRYHAEIIPGAGTPTPYDLHVSNAMTGSHYDYFAEEYLDEFGEVGEMRYRKPAQNPFTFARQPSAFGSYDGEDNFEMDVFFSGHIRALGASDICWVRFEFGDPDVEGFPFNQLDDNYGKQAFPNVANPMRSELPGGDGYDARGMPVIRDAAGDIRGYAGDRLEPSPRRQSFQARDIDWRLTYDYETDPDWLTWLTVDPGENQPYNDAKFYVGVVTGNGDDLSERIYAVLWEEGSYDRSTGLYTVVPQLVRITPTFGELPSSPTPGPPVWHPYEDLAVIGRYDVFSEEVGDTGVSARALLAPSARADAAGLGAWADTENNAQRWPAVTLQINPASGTVTWSTMLFNPDDPEDPMAVFNRDNTPEIADIVMYADYTPFVKRVTTDPASDDSPSAFYNAADDNRLTVFWRRTYGDNDPPHFGRPTFMHRTWTRSIKLGHELGTISSVSDHTMGEALTAYTQVPGTSDIISIDPATGELPLSPRRIGHHIEVQYEDSGGTARVEHHAVLGWSVETPVPVNNVVGEGPLRVTPEVYELAGLNTVRYWLTWSSPRSVYDIRPSDDEGQRLHQTTDVYTAVVVPDSRSMIGDLAGPSIGR